ncbi:MAG: hypothetical protein U1D30_08960 [Planctomycetota bacterium]
MTAGRLKTLMPLGLFFALFLLLATWKRDILHSPPYWDCSFAHWTEAIYLVDSNFDYDGLRNREKHGTVGGARAYMTSVVPTFLALLMMAIDDPGTVIFLFHLFVLACVSALMTLLFTVLAREIGWRGAGLVSLAMLTTPMFITQAEMVNMDFPMVFLGYASAVALWRKRYVAGAILSLAAYLIKATGAIMTLASMAFLSLLLLLSWSHVEGKLRRRAILIGLLANALAITVEVAVAAWGGTYRYHSDPKNRPLIASSINIRFWAPDLTILFLLAAIPSTFLVIVAIWQMRNEPGTSWGRRLFLTVDQNAHFLFSWICVIGTILATTRVILLPRYLLLAIPFLFSILGLLFFKEKPFRLSIAIGFICLIFFNGLNSHGRFFPSISNAIGEEYARTGALLERSREYLADHEANLRAMKYLETHCPDDVIIAGHPFVYFLSHPRLGYVKKPLRGLTINEFSIFWPYFRDIREIDATEIPPHPVEVTVRNTYYQYSLTFQRPWPDKNDQILFKDDLTPPLVIFRKTWDGKEPSPKELEDWYVERLLPWAVPADRVRLQTTFLLQQGRNADAIRLARREQEERPLDLKLGLFVAKLLQDQGRPGAAIEVAVGVLAANSMTLNTSGSAATTSTTDPDSTLLNEVQSFLARAVASTNQRPLEEQALGHFAFASQHYHAGNYDSAIAEAEKAVALDANLAEAHSLLAQLLAERGDVGEAEKHYIIADQRESDSANFHFNFARLLVRQGNGEHAKTQLKKALELRPDFRQAREQWRRLSPNTEPPDSPAQAVGHP